MNSFDKYSVKTAALSIIAEIYNEREKILEKQRNRSLFAKIFASQNYDRLKVECWRGNQYRLCETILFKASNCINSSVILDSEEIEAIQANWNRPV